MPMGRVGEMSKKLVLRFSIPSLSLGNTTPASLWQVAQTQVPGLRREGTQTEAGACHLGRAGWGPRSAQS